MKANGMFLWSILAVSACSDGPRIDWRYSADLNGDGVVERVEVRDLNGNGRPDPLGDLHLVGSGKSLAGRLRIEAEFDLDGEADELLVFIDRNSDGVVDTSEGWLHRYLDLDDDGVCDDLDSDLHELDLTGRGFVHERIRYLDADRDGDADLRCDYPSYNLYAPEQTYKYIIGDRCMRQTWRGPMQGFGYWLHLDDDDDNLFPAHRIVGLEPSIGAVFDSEDADGAGTHQHRVRHPQGPLGIGLEGRRTTGEAHRWYDLDGDGFTDMHLRDYGSGMMRWSFDWDGDAPLNYRLSDPVPSLDSHTDYDVAFHTLSEVPRDWWAGDQLKFWDFLVGFDLPGYYRQPGSAFDFGRDFIPASSCVYYTLQAPWQIISLNWLEDQEDAAETKDVGCHRFEGIWSYYYDFDPGDAFIGSRRDFDRDADSNFRFYLSPIDSLYHLYEAEDGIFYRDPDCRRNHFMLRPTPENVRRYVREIITYKDSDDDGFFDTFAYDTDLDGKPDRVVSRPEADRAEITDMTRIWRLGSELEPLYSPGAEETEPVDFQVEIGWVQGDYDLEARVRASASRPLDGYQLWLRADEHVDYNILFRRSLAGGRRRWRFSEKVPRAQFILPGVTNLTALLVNNVGRIVGRYPVGAINVKPLNSPSMHVGYYRAWSGLADRDQQSFVRMPPEATVRVGQGIKIEVGLEFMASREMILVFEPFLTDEAEQVRWPLGKRVYGMATGELMASASMNLVPFGDEVIAAAGPEADSSMPVSLEDYLAIRENGDRIYVPPGRTYRPGFRLYVDGELVEDRVLYYDWLKEIPQTIRVLP